MKRSKFSLSHYKLMSMQMGGLYPCGLVEVLPGDSFQHSTSALVRVSPLVSPVMHPVHMRIHHWYVPHRIVFPKWEQFITGGEDGMDTTVLPTITITGDTGGTGSLWDYLGGCPQTVGNSIGVSALPFRGYALIWNEWYRDQDLQEKLIIDTEEGSDTTTNTSLVNVGWEKDYFTTARPWTEKGPQVTIPLVGHAPVIGDGLNAPIFQTQQGNPTSPLYAGGTAGANVISNATPAGNLYWENPALQADLTEASGIDINELRMALAIQRYQEARARYGSRYTEYLRYLGIRSSDARLQRPEYLGGGKQTIQFSEILQTAPNAEPDTGGLGNLGGHGIGAIRSNRYRRFFEEHGYVFSFISVKPRTIYSQGIPRTWLKRVKEDYWQKELQHVGQQEVMVGELYGAASVPTNTFGFQDRYDEYRRMESQVLGEFRTSTLDFWHMARTFSSEPVLNASFVQSNPTNRIFADQTGADTLYVMASHSIQARRMLTAAGTSFTF
ncbi:major capsid protein [robinz microvirus RP_48]|nr:major capsid protein [robinz microvirus RP_48]